MKFQKLWDKIMSTIKKIHPKYIYQRTMREDPKNWGIGAFFWIFIFWLMVINNGKKAHVGIMNSSNPEIGFIVGTIIMMLYFIGILIYRKIKGKSLSPSWWVRKSSTERIDS